MKRKAGKKKSAAAKREEHHRNLIGGMQLELGRMKRAVAAAAEDLVIYVAAIRSLVAMLDASRFGGDRQYRCLTAEEETKLETCRALTVFPSPQPLPKSGGNTPPAPGS